MTESAAERIVLDGEVLAQQIKVLGEVSSSLGAQVGPAQARIGSTAFGAMNTFLVPAMNNWASRTAEVVSTARELADRMQTGVSSARDQFEQLEEQYADVFAKGEQ